MATAKALAIRHSPLAPPSPLVDPVKAMPQAREHLIADGAQRRRQLVDAEPAADQRGEVAAARAAVGDIGHVDADQIHGNASGQRAALAGHDYLPGRLVAVAGGRAQESVRIAHRDDGDAGCPLGREARRVTHRVAALDFAHLEDAALQLDHWAHRIALARRRVAAGERNPRTYQVALNRAAA